MAKHAEDHDSESYDDVARQQQQKEFSENSSREKDSRDRKEHGDRDRHRDRESSRSRSKSERHEKEHRSDRHRSKDREHSREKERGNDRERSRDREGRSRERDRRHHDYDYDRERRHRHRTRSRSRGRSGDRKRSRSRSKSRDEKSKRASGFDMAPPNVATLPGMPLPGQLPGLTPTLPGVLPGFSFAGTPLAALSGMPLQAMTQQAMKHARRVYVGGLPPLANEQTIAAYFSQVMHVIGGNSAPGDAVVNVYINHEKKFAFVEMRTVEEASNAMALDGIMFEGMPVRVRRPSDYNPSLAATLGPSQPNPNLNLAAIGLTPGIAGGADGPDKVFVGGLPYYLTEVQIKELLESFGPLRGFDLVKDRETGNSKGYAFCVYQDPAVTDVACAALNGLKMGDKTLTVRRATAGSGQPKPDQENVLLQAQQQIAMQKLALQSSAAIGFMPAFGVGMVPGSGLAESPTKVLCLTQLVSVDELRDDKEFEDIYQDVQDECGKYGNITSLVIPRPSPTGEQVPGLGKAFVEYTDTEGSSRARLALNGRKFAGNTVLAVYYPEDKFARGEMDG